MSLVGSAFPVANHLAHLAALGGCQPAPRTPAALHDLPKGKIEPAAFLEELSWPWWKLRAAHGA
eukprot:CAMPEP_0172594054 /NCGR_PEP_ID=MMETSP1068-20121228/13335_1 /TAXON_ID=35684 /ORGANISM="Pseudopedinella elastica, Strain CCMP716" /LENGTH=63 /DNA_ID=CAMNT_0013391843 /DNA_START=123 /DNA_END=311 /DNA_ORIENTATION=-